MWWPFQQRDSLPGDRFRKCLLHERVQRIRGSCVASVGAGRHHRFGQGDLEQERRNAVHAISSAVRRDVVFQSVQPGDLVQSRFKVGPHDHPIARDFREFSNIYASPVGAAGRVYVTGRNGTTLVMERSDELKILAKNTLDERFDASAAVAGDQLFLRGAKFLYCIASSK